MSYHSCPVIVESVGQGVQVHCTDYRVSIFPKCASVANTHYPRGCRRTHCVWGDQGLIDSVIWYLGSGTEYMDISGRVSTVHATSARFCNLCIDCKIRGPNDLVEESTVYSFCLKSLSVVMKGMILLDIPNCRESVKLLNSAILKQFYTEYYISDPRMRYPSIQGSLIQDQGWVGLLFLFLFHP